MKQIVMEDSRKSKIIEVDVPRINENQLLVKVEYTGMCHSEWYPWSTAKAGDIFGHETAGIVAQVGRAVNGFACRAEPEPTLSNPPFQVRFDVSYFCKSDDVCCSTNDKTEVPLDLGFCQKNRLCLPGRARTHSVKSSFSSRI